MKQAPPSRRITAVIVLAVLLVTAYAGKTHLNRLGQQSFWDDEFTHLYAAQSLLNNGTPAMPSGWLYTRSLPYTYLVAGSFSQLGVSEFSARLPSALISIATIPVIFLIIWYLFDMPTALLSAIYVAVDPISFVFGRISRMYSLFELLFLLLAFSIYMLGSAAVAFAPARLRPDRPASPGGTRLLVLLFWLTAVAALTYLAGAVQFLVIFIVPGLLLYLAVSPRSKDEGVQRFKMKFVGVSAAIGGVLYLSLYSTVSRMLPPQTSTGGLAYYWQVMGEFAPLVMPLAAIGVFYSWKGRHVGGLYFSSIVIAGLLVQGVLFAGWSSIRYVLHFMPLLYVIAMYGLIMGFKDLRAWLVKVPRIGPAVTFYRLLAVLAMVLFLVGRAVTTEKSPLLGYSHTPDYRAAFDYVRTEHGYNTKDPLISTIPLATLYYGGRVDYWLRQNNYEPYLLRYYLTGQGDTDKELYTAATLIRDVPELKAMLARQPSGWLLADSRFGNLSKETRAYVKQHMQLVYAKEGRIRIYRWSSGNPD